MGGVSAHVRMYSRRACGLCDQARAVIESERRRSGFAFEEVRIDGDDELELAYGLRIPVVLVDGTEVFELHVDAERLRRLVVPRSGPGRLLRALGTLVRS